VSIFLSLPGQIVFYAVFFSIFLCSHSLLILTRIRRAPSTKAKFGPGARSILLAGSLFLWSLVLVSALFGYTGIGVLPDWTYYLGLSLSILGNGIWFWGYQTLGRFYSQELVIYQGHQLVERGPFRFVRHPMYTGLILVYVGIGWAVQSWAAVVLTSLAATMLPAYRIPVEEKTLISEFGEQYMSYSKRVKRLIPFIF
jgi:protein-S-isoprenylcysteine O-methyltransferase Ste14